MDGLTMGCPVCGATKMEPVATRGGRVFQCNSCTQVSASMVPICGTWNPTPPQVGGQVEVLPKRKKRKKSLGDIESPRQQQL